MKHVNDMTVEELKCYIYDASKILQKIQQEIQVCENKIMEIMQKPIEKNAEENNADKK